MNPSWVTLCLPHEPYFARCSHIYTCVRMWVHSYVSACPSIATRLQCYVQVCSWKVLVATWHEGICECVSAKVLTWLRMPRELPLQTSCSCVHEGFVMLALWTTREASWPFRYLFLTSTIDYTSYHYICVECTVTVVYVCNAYIYIHADYMYNVWLYMYVQHVLCIMYIRTHMYRVMKLSKVLIVPNNYMLYNWCPIPSTSSRGSCTTTYMYVLSKQEGTDDQATSSAGRINHQLIWHPQAPV